MAEITTTTTPTTTSAPPQKKKAPGLTFKRYFTKAGVSPYDELEWELRLAQITDSQGGIIFEQKDVEVPKDWSMTATNIVASKYLHGPLETPERETGARQLVTRVAETIRDWGIKGGYFRSDEDAAIFHDELAHLLLQQKAAFNSPVWFNVGCDRIEPNSDAQNWHWNPQAQRVEYSVTGYRNPQCSACFINSVHDSLDSILTLAKTEGMLFKWGSGTGTNLSPLRSSTEALSGGGTASGPLSFMKGFDAFAGVIKSGGKTRRAAKMVILNIDHPDVVDFIECKQKEEAKAWALVEHGYDGSGPDSEAYSSIFFQNANNSVRVTDDFMYAVLRDSDFSTRAVKDGRPLQTFKARELLRKISDATWHCGDPGMQYDTTINRWHTSKNTARINASNPCSEYMFLDDSACNLASAEPDEVRAQRHVRRRGLSLRLRRHDYRAGNSGGQQRLSHRSHRQELARLPSAGTWLRQPRRAADGRGPALRLRRRTRLRRLRHRHHVRRSLSAVVEDRRTLPAAGPGNRKNRCHPERAKRVEGPLRSRKCGSSLSRLVHQPRTLPRRHPHAPRVGEQHQPHQRSPCALRSQQGHLGRGSEARREVRLSQLAGHGAGAHRHHRLHDGLRHHRHRA